MRRIALAMALALGLGGGEATAGLDVPPQPVDMSRYATKDQVPPASSSTPAATGLDSDPGTAPAYARSDHTHAARVQRTAVVTDANGVAVWTFARPIVVAPGKVPLVSYMVEDTGTPVVVQITGRTSTTVGGLDVHTAVTVKAQRSRTLPAALVTIADLLKFDVFGTAAVAVRVNLFAADPTQ